jgi:hypothetical protein
LLALQIGERYSDPKKLQPESQRITCIYGQYLNGCPANRSLAENTLPLKFEVLSPDVGSRVKQANKLTRLRVQSGDVGAFVTVTVRTCEGEIAQNGFTPMLLGDDVIDLNRKVSRFLFHENRGVCKSLNQLR